MDSGKLIDATVNARKGPIRAAQRRQAAVAWISQVSTLKGKLDTLKTTLEDLEENKDVLALSATSGDEDILTVSATGEASRVPTSSSHELGFTREKPLFQHLRRPTRSPQEPSASQSTARTPWTSPSTRATT